MTEKIPDAHDLTKKLVGLKNNDSRDMLVESTLNNIPDEYMEHLMQNWSQWTDKNTTVKFADNNVNGTHAQAKFFFETNGSDTPVLYNYTYGFGVVTGEAEDTTPPTVVLNQPADTSSLLNIQNISINITTTDSSGLANCSVWANFSGSWVLNQTNSTDITSGSKYTFPLEYNFSNGYYIWNAQCFDNSVNFNEGWGADNFTLTISSPAVDSCSYTLNSNWNVEDQCIKTNEYVNLGTGNLTILTGGSVVLVNSNMTVFSYNISTADSDKVVLNFSWSDISYFFNTSIT